MAAEPAIEAFFENHGRPREFASGERIINAGAEPGGVCLLRSGAVKVLLVGRSGRESVLEVREAGALVGEMSAILGGPRSAAVAGLLPGELVWVSARDFQHALSDSTFAMAVLRETARRLGQASVHQHEIAAGDSGSRVARVLVDLAERIGERKGSTVRLEAITQQDLADFAGVSRDGVVRALTVFRTNGWVDTSRRSVSIADIGMLRAAAEI